MVLKKQDVLQQDKDLKEASRQAKSKMASFTLPHLPETGDKFGPPNEDVYSAVPQEFRGIPFAPFAKVSGKD